MNKILETKNNFIKNLSLVLGVFVVALTFGMTNVSAEELTADEMAAACESEGEYCEFVPADYSKLDSLLNNEGNTIILTGYTDASVALFESLMDNASELPRDLNKNGQQIIDDLVLAIYDSIAKLEPKPELDYAALEDLYNFANGKILYDTDGNPFYTDDSIEEFNTALDNAEYWLVTIKDGYEEYVTQEELDDALKELREAMLGLEFNEAYYFNSSPLEENPDLNWEDLSDAILDGWDYISVNNRDNYTKESLDNLSYAIDLAETLDEQPNLDEETQMLFNEMTEYLKNAIKSLKFKNYDVFEALIDYYGNFAPDYYTDESLNDLANILLDAMDAAWVYKNITFEQMAEAIENIKTASNELTPKDEYLIKEIADYAEIDALLEEYETLKLELDKYTKDSVKNYLDKINVAANLSRTLSYDDDQDYISDIVNSIEDAKKEFKLLGEETIEVPGVVDPESDEINVGAVIDNDTKEAIMESASDELQEAIDNARNNGDNVSIKVVSETIDFEDATGSVLNDIYDILDSLDENTTAAQFFDLSIVVTVNGSTIGNITNTNELVTFQIAIPEELLKEGRTFKVVRIHDGIVSTLNSIISDNIITFTTDKFSTYALVYTDRTVSNTVTNETKTSANTVKTSNPQTGDTVGLYVMLLLLSLVGLAGMRKARQFN